MCTRKSRTEHTVTNLIFDGCLLHVFTHFSCCTHCAEKATPFGAFVDACCKARAFAYTCLFTCSSLRHIRFCGEEAHLDCALYENMDADATVGADVGWIIST